MNKNLKRKLGIAAFSVIGCVAFSCGATTMKNASAENAFDTAQIEMIAGASVRYYADSASTNESGIRFSAAIDSTVYQALEDMESANVTVSYGMLIAPYDYYQENAFNEKTVFGVNGDKQYTWDGDADATTGSYKKIAHVTYDELTVSTQENWENYHEIRGSLIDIKPENLTKEFIGRGYIKYQAADGTTSYKFASFEDDNVDNNVRSIVYVSQLAIDKNDPASSWLNTNYVSKVAETATTYTIETYVGNVLVKKSEPISGVKIDQSLTSDDVTVAEYQGFENVSAETTGKVYANGRTVLKHVYQEEENSDYQVKNGGFEEGELTAWTVSGEIGAVSNASNYWVGDSLNADGFPFGKDGEYMFSSYAVSSGDEKTGYLQSDAFTVGENGWLTFKIGAMKNTPFTYVEIVDSTTGEIYKRYGNTKFTDKEADGVKPGCKMYAYKANIADLKGKSVYIRISDYAISDYGVVFADSFNALHIGEPSDEYVLATELGFSNNAYELYNGNFNNGLDGWIRNGEIGVINSKNTTYWNEKYPYNNEGSFFSAYKTDGIDGANDVLENKTGTLKSGLFTIGGSGWITYRIGGVKNPDQVYMEVIEATTGEKLGHFYNENMDKCTMISYKADLSDFIGKLVYINFVDNATTDYGLIFCDEFVTYYASETDVPAYNLATNCVYNVMNGGFETGNLSGWTLVKGEVPGRVTEYDTYWNDDNRVIGKEGNYSFTGVKINDSLDNLEGRIGILRSNTFILKANSSISFKLGGCRPDNYDVCLRIVNAQTGEVIDEYTNVDRLKDGVDSEAKLVYYSHAIDCAEEISCYVELYDNATENWGLLGVDSINIFQEIVTE